MKIYKPLLLCSSVLALGILYHVNNAHADTDLSTVQVNQTNPQKNQTATQSKNFLNQPNNSLQTSDDTSTGSSTTGLNNNYDDDNFFNDYGYSHFTRYNLENMQKNIISDLDNPIGDFSGLTVKDVSSAKDTRKGYKGQQMNVWDSWPLQDANGNEVTYKGYHVVFALAGNPKKDYTSSNGTYIQDGHIYVFYQKVGQENKGISSWKNAGPLFKNSKEGSNGNDTYLNHEAAEWSGETVKMSDGSLRILYTNFTGAYKHGLQIMTTAQINLKKTKNGLAVNHKAASDHKSILQPDGNKYQTLSQATNDNTDENAFRDAHYFEYNGHKYVIFEANSGLETGYQGQGALYNTAYLGGSSYFQRQEQNLTIPSTMANGKTNPWHLPAKDYNSVIGMAELNDDYTVKQLMNPILGLNTITDEFERPNLFEHNGKWYLFGITRGYKLATPNVKSTNSYMLGFVADSPFGPFKPLNDNGLVVRNTRAWHSRYYTYSFYVLNNGNDSSNRFVVTDYMTNTKNSAGHQTFGYSFGLNLNGSQATVNKELVLPQNATTVKNTKNLK